MNDLIGDYTRLIRDGRIREAFRRILSFMSTLKTRLEKQHPDHAIGALYAGTMDMTCFSFTPPALRQRNLKIVLVYLHGENRFEAWLGGATDGSRPSGSSPFPAKLLHRIICLKSAPAWIPSWHCD